MHSTRDDPLTTALAEADCRVREFNARVDEQRSLVDKLIDEGCDATSASIVLDSLIFTVFLCVQERHRLLTLADTKVTQADAA